MLQGQATQAVGHPTTLGCGVLICISSWNTPRPRGVNELFRNRLEDDRDKGTEGLRGTHRPRRAELRTQTEERLDHGHEVATQGDTEALLSRCLPVPPTASHPVAPGRPALHQHRGGRLLGPTCTSVASARERNVPTPLLARGLLPSETYLRLMNIDENYHCN